MHVIPVRQFLDAPLFDDWRGPRMVQGSLELNLWNELRLIALALVADSLEE